MNHGVLVNMTVIEWTHHWGASVVRNDWVGIWVTTCLYTPTPLGWFYGVELNWIDSRGVKGDTLAPGEAGNKIRSAQVDGWGVKRVPLRPRWSNCPLIENNGRLVWQYGTIVFHGGLIGVHSAWNTRAILLFGCMWPQLCHACGYCCTAVTEVILRKMLSPGSVPICNWAVSSKGETSWGQRLLTLTQ